MYMSRFFLNYLGTLLVIFILRSEQVEAGLICTLYPRYLVIFLLRRK